MTINELFVKLSDKLTDEKIDIINTYADEIKYGRTVIRRVETKKSEYLDIIYIDNAFLNNQHDLYTIDWLDDILYNFVMSLENDRDALEVLSDLIEG